MDRQLTTSTVSIDRRESGDATPAGADVVSAVFDRHAREQHISSTLDATEQAPLIWTHTLVLTGELTRRSAHALETEMERLCEDGVTGITLDLRQLGHIDAIGVAVIAFRCGLYQRRGLGVSLIPGPKPIQRAFERTGVTELLPFQVDEVAARRRRAPALRMVRSRRS
ncbi:MAG TPA: STAS domain-containing protein [Solirubrobacteraceae bacterium]|jgi:anti-anti-sigma factor|nr:STAS domain-containing protein [Solirubrobacteraceae bacterium]